MTRSEAEEIFVAAIMSGEDRLAIELKLTECQVFRVLVGRTLKEMEKKNRTLWLKARDYGIEYKEPYMYIMKLDANRFKMQKVGKDGKMTPYTPPNAEVSKNDNAANNEVKK
jgi:hypothetical protein